MTSFVSKACYRISVYEKSTEKLAWLLGFRAFRELLVKVDFFRAGAMGRLIQDDFNDLHVGVLNLCDASRV